MRQLRNKAWLCDMMSESALIQLLHIMIMTVLTILKKEEYKNPILVPYIYISIFLILIVFTIIGKSLKFIVTTSSIREITLFDTICILVIKLPLFLKLILELVVYIPLFLHGNEFMIYVYYIAKTLILCSGIYPMVVKTMERMVDENRALLMEKILNDTGKDVIIK